MLRDCLKIISKRKSLGKFYTISKAGDSRKVRRRVRMEFDTAPRDIFVRILPGLHEAEHEGLGGYHAQEHGERVDGGVGYGRSVAAG